MARLTNRSPAEGAGPSLARGPATAAKRDQRTPAVRPAAWAALLLAPVLLLVVSRHFFVPTDPEG